MFGSGGAGRAAEVAVQAVSNAGQPRGGHRIVRNVVEEGMTGPACVGRNGDAGPGVCRRIALDQHVARTHELRESARARLEMAVGVRHDLRHVEHIRVGEPDAELGRSLCLDLSPIADVADLIAGNSRAARSAVSAVEHLAVGNRSP